MTRKEFEKIKADWFDDPIFDLVEEVTPEYKSLAETFVLQNELKWRQQEVAALQTKLAEYEAFERVASRIF